MRHFDYRTGDDGTENLLFAESVDLRRIADEVGTPCFVYVQATIERHFRVFDAAFEGHPHTVCYAVKANSNLAVLTHLAGLGSGADIVSAGELVRARKAGIPGDRIVFSGVGKTKDEMALALDEGILTFNVESEPELYALADVARQKGKVAPVALRVNPNVDAQTHPYIATGLKSSKFGIPIDAATRIATDIAGVDSLELRGVACHIGSQMTSLDPLMEALESVLSLVDELEAAGHPIQNLDIGGGLGIPYKGERPPHPSELGSRVVDRMKGRSERIILEPGRVIVGNAGLLLTRVLYVKETPTKTFVIVDAGMNDLLRPSLYKAHHDIWPVRKDESAGNVVADVVGPICESTDAFAKDREIQVMEPGDLAVVMSAGAYGFSMASTYNSRPICAEVLVHGDRYHIARTRMPIEDLMAGESPAPWNETES